MNENENNTTRAKELLFEHALGIESPWFVKTVDFDKAKKVLSITVDFTAGSKFPHSLAPGNHHIYDTVLKRFRHLDFFEYECFLEVRIPRLKLPDGSIRHAEVLWLGKISGFTLMFEAMVLSAVRNSSFTAAAEQFNISVHRAIAICQRYVSEALECSDLSQVKHLSVAQASFKNAEDHVTLVADADRCTVILLIQGNEPATIQQITEALQKYGCDPRQVNQVSIDLLPCFVREIAQALPNARILFDKVRVLHRAASAVEQISQHIDKDSKHGNLAAERASNYKKQLVEILDSKNGNIQLPLRQWCTNVLRSRIQPLRSLAQLIKGSLCEAAEWQIEHEDERPHRLKLFELLESAKRESASYRRFGTLEAITLLRYGSLDYSKVNSRIARFFEM